MSYPQPLVGAFGDECVILQPKEGKTILILGLFFILLLVYYQLMMEISEQLKKFLQGAGVTGEIGFSTPPQAELGDFAFGCFGLGKDAQKNPAEVAKELAAKLSVEKNPLVERVTAFGPYVNFFLNGRGVAESVVERGDGLAAPAKAQSGEILLLEFAHPNTHKAFHIGHLRNIITGESLVRIFEHAGHRVVRANYQGDVGLHIAKCLFGIFQADNFRVEIDRISKSSPGDQARFLGACYAAGSQAYETDESAKAEIVLINQKLYAKDPEILDLYQTTRQWSLNYFEHNIYRRLGTHFDRLYFESEVFGRAVEIVREFLGRGVFKESEGAVIFEGSKYGLHDRVFLNSQGLPTYEAKDLALAERQFKEHNPAHIYHVVAKEQSEYFKVVFKALEFTLPPSAGREHHLVYGWVGLKEGKMSSRTGQVILAEELLNDVQAAIAEMMREGSVADKEPVAERVALGAVKYAFLKTSTSNDITFDLKSSISLNGDSGAYLLYMCARIKSILRKEEAGDPGAFVAPAEVAPQEKALLFQLDQFQAIVMEAAETKDPSKVAHYIFILAQKFTAFYEHCPVLKAEPAVRQFRLGLLRLVLAAAERGLYLLGIETVEEM